MDLVKLQVWADTEDEAKIFLYNQLDVTSVWESVKICVWGPVCRRMLGIHNMFHEGIDESR